MIKMSRCDVFKYMLYQTAERGELSKGYVGL